MDYQSKLVYCRYGRPLIAWCDGLDTANGLLHILQTKATMTPVNTMPLT